MCAVCINLEQDVVAYTVRALGCGHVINKQLHIRPKLNQLSQHGRTRSSASSASATASHASLSARLSWTPRLLVSKFEKLSALLQLFHGLGCRLIDR